MRSRPYDPLDNWADKRRRKSKNTTSQKKKKVEVGLGGKTYVYKSSSDSSGESVHEACFEDIEAEELETSRIGDREDELERKL